MRDFPHYHLFDFTTISIHPSTHPSIHSLCLKWLMLLILLVTLVRFLTLLLQPNHNPNHHHHLLPRKLLIQPGSLFLICRSNFRFSLRLWFNCKRVSRPLVISHSNHPNQLLSRCLNLHPLMVHRKRLKPFLTSLAIILVASQVALMQKRCLMPLPL